MDAQKYLRQRDIRVRYGGISNATVWRWVRDGLLPPPQKPRPNLNIWERANLDEHDKEVFGD